MAKIPQAIDYGGRPSLRSNRVDVPGRGRLAVADALSNAASTFANMAIEHKQKDDALNYSNAKNEYLIADIQEREKLKNDLDYETHDERYRTAMAVHFERIFPTITGRRDAALFDSESKLLNERGAVDVGTNAWEKEIDTKVARWRRNSEANKAAMLVADPQTARDLMLTQMDQTRELGKQGILTPDEVVGENKKSVQAWAYDRLVTMDPIEREEVLERSVTSRNTVGPITEEDLRGGKGTGSIADFLDQATATKMLRETQKINVADTFKEDGFSANDAAWRLFPEIDQQSERKAYLRKQGLSADARQFAEAAEARELISRGNQRAEEWMGMDIELRQQIRDGDPPGSVTYFDLPMEMVKKLPDQMDRELRRFSNSWAEEQGFSDHTTWEATEAFAQLTPAQRAEWTPDDYMQRANPTDTPKVWNDVIDRSTAEMWMSQARQDKEAQAKGVVSESGLSNTQLIDNTLTATDYFARKPTASDSAELKDRWARLTLAIDSEWVRRGGAAKLNATEKRQAISDVLRFEAYVRGPWHRRDKKQLIASMTPEQLKNSYLPLDWTDSNGLNAHTATISYKGYSGPTYGWLVNIWASTDPARDKSDPDDNLLEEAYFYLVTEGPEAAIRQLADPVNY